MKYKVGDKVKYDGGDWWFFGTISAVFEDVMYPCYRLNVERMETKTNKLSITQFEFELEPDLDARNALDNRKWENAEIEYLKKYYGVLTMDDLSKVLQRSPHALSVKYQQLISEMELQLEPSIEPGTEQYVESEIDEPVEETKMEKTKSKPKKGEIWYRNFEMYCNGEKSNIIHSWISQNRKQFKDGILSEDKIEKLQEINFPFEATRKKRLSEWDKQFLLWKKGERNSLLQWRQRNVKLYVEGRLEKDKIEKLKEIGILK
ncbi:MAG: helicase associated domain-containing protein [Tannerella sp.]|jgi:hypothetical protein|nr:helicase associated domain-containing protein [Tannerella sp.]